jgi:hypothetical protein
MHTLQNSNIACAEVISLFAIPLANFFADDLIIGTDSKSFIRLSPRFEYTYWLIAACVIPSSFAAATCENL